MIKFKVIENTKSSKSFEKEVGEFLGKIKGELIKISMNRHWKGTGKGGIIWVAFIAYKD